MAIKGVGTPYEAHISNTQTYSVKDSVKQAQKDYDQMINDAIDKQLNK